jgi:hypothetical protein
MASSNHPQTKMDTVYPVGFNGSIGHSEDGALQFWSICHEIEVMRDTNVARFATICHKRKEQTKLPV